MENSLNMSNTLIRWMSTHRIRWQGNELMFFNVKIHSYKIISNRTRYAQNLTATPGMPRIWLQPQNNQIIPSMVFVISVLYRGMLRSERYIQQSSCAHILLYLHEIWTGKTDQNFLSYLTFSLTPVVVSRWTMDLEFPASNAPFPNMQEEFKHVAGSHQRTEIQILTSIPW